METDFSKGIEHIMVIPLDMDKYNADIDKSVKEQIAKAGDSTLVSKLKEGEEFYVNSRYALIVGTNMLTDKECVAELLDNTETAKITFDVYSQVKLEGQLKSFGIVPKFTTSTTIGELLKEYGQPQIPLKDFMGNYFDRGHRIRSNQYEIVKEFEKQTRVKKRLKKAK